VVSVSRVLGMNGVSMFLSGMLINVLSLLVGVVLLCFVTVVCVVVMMFVCEFMRVMLRLKLMVRFIFIG